MFYNLTSVVVEVRAGVTYRLTRHMGRAIQQVLLRHVVEPHDADLSQTLHDSSGLKPYTVSGLMRPDTNQPLYGDVNQGDRAWFRMVGLGRPVTEALRDWAFVPPDLVEIDNLPWWIETAHTDRAGHHAASSTHYRTLVEAAEQDEPQHKLPLTFLVTTAFHSGGMNLPFPLPTLVFGSLLRQWEAFSGLPLPPLLHDFIEHYVMLSRYELGTEILSFKQGSKQIGFTGAATYQIARRNHHLERQQPEREAALQTERERLTRMVGLLLDFGVYSGVGIKTTAGMGMMSRG